MVGFQPHADWLQSATHRDRGRQGFWAISIHPVTAWALTGYYGATLILIICIIVFLATNQICIRPGWDMECIADYLALFNTFNISLSSDTSLDGDFVLPTISEEVYHYVYRLGYWKVLDGDSETIAYGIRGVPHEERTSLREHEKRPHSCFICSANPALA